MARNTADKDLRARIAQALWTAMDENDMTQKELCKEAHVNERVLNNTLYERNLMRLDDLVKICRVLDISLDCVVGLYD
jgi:DNA-binding Xre family transcriptional regulator